MRPFWLIGGTAVVTVLSICALIVVCALAAFLWFSNQTLSNSRQGTQVAIQRQTQQAAAVTPTRVTPTVSVSPTATIVLLPTPTLLPVLPASSPAPNTTFRPAADQMVRTYYTLVGQQRYDLTWPMLSDAFKQRFNCCAPSYNYSGYVSWWDSVNYVEFGNVRTISQNADRAVVYAELFYVMNDGARSSMDNTPYIHLVFDPTFGYWRFDDKRATP